jgi:hypothetical protein
MNLESPRRIDVGIAALKDFIDLLNDGVEFGLASFAAADGSPNPPGGDSTKDFPSVPGLQVLDDTADRTNAKNSIDGLSGRTGGNTRIGAGLLKARDTLLEGGGTVTLNTAVLLVTDGLNNRPAGNAQMDLDDALKDLADASIPVFVTCIGEGRDTQQCSDIADQTMGFFVDSSETQGLLDSFVEFAAKAQGYEIACSEMGMPIGEGEISAAYPVLIEEGVDSARFVVTWTQPGSDLDLLLFRPNGSMVSVGSRVQATQGEFYLIPNPEPGVWSLKVVGVSVPEPEEFSARALVDHKELSVDAGLARSSVDWPEGFMVSANPFMGLPIEGCENEVLVEKPDGSIEIVELRDDGTQGDPEEGDGLYALEYANFTAGDGIYTFTVRIHCEEGVAEFHHHEDPGIGQFSTTADLPTFDRVIRFSGTVMGVPQNLPPTAEICQDVRAECAGDLTSVTLDGTCSSDPEGGALSYAWSSPTGSFVDPNSPVASGSFPLGRNSVALVVEDPEGLGASADGLVVIVDTTPPEIASLTATPATLWPPTGRMVSISVDPVVSDVCDSAPVCEIVSIRGSEPDEGKGDGKRSGDIEQTGPLSASVRAERSGAGIGRVYLFTVECRDGSGNTATTTTTVTVSHDLGSR